MVKIKRKVEKNLPQLIEWAMDNDVTDRMFLTENSYCVGFDRHGFIYFNSSRTMPLYQTFTVEVEEEITEDTVIDKLVAIDSDNDALVFSNYTIKEIKNSGFKEFHAYIDGEFKLIWTKEKGLVE
ncbi:hypothetical protein [Staphylococcus saprophyticus]|uniref:hypothetical protein n=1 Tax=Staphylococcus saprophyticus TaxID=29385 RepID=UPI00374ED726